ncbi:hypothetical protein P8452_38698 [Trifolium repens]|nr:hypothetical protein P8452_38698 [Trifolium repens]
MLQDECNFCFSCFSSIFVVEERVKTLILICQKEVAKEFGIPVNSSAFGYGQSVKTIHIVRIIFLHRSRPLFPNPSSNVDTWTKGDIVCNKYSI